MKQTILFAEPDPFFRDIYEKRLNEEGFEVVSAAHGERLTDLVKQVQPQALLMALALPRKDGFEVLEELRALPEAQDLPIFILSRIGSREVVERCFEQGACAYFIKSHHDPDDVVAHIQSHLDV